MKRNLWRYGLRLLPGLGLLSLTSCLSRFEGNVDLLFGLRSVENLLVVPYSAVAGLAEFLVRNFG